MLKRIMCVMAVSGVLAVGSAQASDASASGRTLEQCKDVSNLARSIMEKRQSGEKMSAMMDAAASIEDEVVSKGAQELIIMAFENPAYSTTEFQERATLKFENDMYLICVKTRRKN